MVANDASNLVVGVVSIQGIEFALGRGALGEASGVFGASGGRALTWEGAEVPGSEPWGSRGGCPMAG